MNCSAADSFGIFFGRGLSSLSSLRLGVRFLGLDEDKEEEEEEDKEDEEVLLLLLLLLL
jgi:hypothetical protein